jgi:hypothetical protein
MHMADEPDVAALLQRARRACEEIAALRNELVLTLAETQRLISEGGPVAPALKIIAVDAQIECIENAIVTSADQAMALEVVRTMIGLMAGFPLEWQFKIIKVLMAHHGSGRNAGARDYSHGVAQCLGQARKVTQYSARGAIQGRIYCFVILSMVLRALLC